ncbi:hypothetical protein JMUB7552_07190 [Staphylococcus aureus]|nr:hypothetical protein JSA_0297 [Staphylococcus aureus]BCD42556.1 hypothetical protein USA300LVJ_03360 [Staphylococcus aureus]GFD65577.1 hypothetical protein ksw1_15540 [Staphylococcus aureus]GFN42515.1 hypothetical protein SAB46_01200 [Staphylococcus aureus]
MPYYIHTIPPISINFIPAYIKKIVICHLPLANKNMFVLIRRYTASMYNDIIIA